MRDLVEALCSDECAGREAGSPGGRLARDHVVRAMSEAGYETEIQAIPAIGGANVLARLAGDHSCDVARALRGRRGKRGVLFAAFDAEEPPHFLGDTMGSQYFVDHPPVPVDAIDLMVCLDLVGHSLGPVGTPSAIRETVFALGAERSTGTAAHVDTLARATPGVVVRRVDAEAIPPLSDYFAFWQRQAPFLFLSNGRSAVYHTPEDTPDRLDYAKMQATSRWLARFVAETCDRREARIEWRADVRDDASTLRTLAAIARALSAVDPAAAAAAQAAEGLLSRCDDDGRLPERHRGQLGQLTAMMESGLA